METLKYCKVRKVKSPNRAHPEDAGCDFFVPEDITREEMSEKCDIAQCLPFVEYSDEGYMTKIHLKPGQSILIPSGIKVKVPKNMMLQFTNKSGIATKRHLLVGANVVDSGYTGVCHINLHNVGDLEEIISAGDKIVQAILIPVVCAQPKEFDNEELLYDNEMSSRSAGGFGSTGTK